MVKSADDESSDDEEEVGPVSIHHSSAAASLAPTTFVSDSRQGVIGAPLGVMSDGAELSVPVVNGRTKGEMLVQEGGREEWMLTPGERNPFGGGIFSQHNAISCSLNVSYIL